MTGACVRVHVCVGVCVEQGPMKKKRKLNLDCGQDEEEEDESRRMKSGSFSRNVWNRNQEFHVAAWAC